MVPFFHLLVAIDDYYYTAYKFVFTKTKTLGGGEKPISGQFGGSTFYERCLLAAGLLYPSTSYHPLSVGHQYSLASVA